MSECLKGKIAVVTGAGRGIGAATAKLFAAEGALVVIASRTAKELEAVGRMIGPGRACAVVADISREEDARRIFDEAEKAFGAVSILVNNAGTVRVAPLAETSAEDWDRTLAVNLRGAFLCSREFFRRRKEGGGSIVNVGSLAGIRGVEKFPGLSAYVASKHGVVGLTEASAVEGRPLGIRVNCVAPGAVGTRMLKEAAPFLKTATTPEDIARAILFLSDEALSPKVTGAVIEIHSNE